MNELTEKKAGMNVLLVEDNGALGNLFKAQLHRVEGDHTAIVVTTKQEVLTALTQDTFDLIFIDMALEGLPYRGLEILKEIKQQYPAQRVGILSSNDAGAIIRDCREYGAEFYMVKPFTYKGLSLILTGSLEEIQHYRSDISEGQILSFVESS